MLFKTIGSILLAGALFAAIAMQLSGRGLVTTSPSTTPPITSPGPKGTTTVVVMGPTTIYHLNRIAPLAAVTILGLLCFFLPNRD